MTLIDDVNPREGIYMETENTEPASIPDNAQSENIPSEAATAECSTSETDTSSPIVETPAPAKKQGRLFGFRTKTPWKMILASIWYVISILMLLTMTLASSNLTMFFAFLPPVLVPLLFSNVGVLNKLPGEHNGRAARIALSALCLVLCFILACVCASSSSGEFRNELSSDDSQASSEPQAKEKQTACAHEWAEATCTQPETCTLCGETKGTPLGHDVQNWATTKEATCSEEGMREGVCARCGETICERVAVIAHTPGDWEITKESTVNSSGTITAGTEEQKCTVCGKTLDTRDYKIEVTTSQLNALRKAASYLNYTAFSYSGLIAQLEFEGFSNEDSSFAADHCAADWMVQAEKKAASYMKYSAFSRSGLIGQLEFEGFAAEQAAHGADSVGL